MTSVFFDPSFYTFQAPLVPPPSGDIELGDNNANQLGSTRSGNTEPPQQQLTRLRDHVLFLHQCIVLGWISLCLYFLFVLMCWAQFRRGDEAIWRNIFPPFVMVQVVAVIDELLKNNKYGACLQERNREHLTHRILHYICLSFTFCLITWKLDKQLACTWVVIFIPMWVDVICGIFLLWRACPCVDAAEAAGSMTNNYVRSILASKAIVHFFSWGVQILFIAMKLDKVVTWAWHTVLFVWAVMFVIIAIRMLHLSLLLPLQCYSMLVRYWESLSCNQKFMVLETTVAPILLWSWVLIGFITFTNILVLCVRFNNAINKDSTKKFYDVITQHELDIVFWPVVSLLFASIVILPFLVRILTLYAVNGIVSEPVEYPYQEVLSMDALSSPVQIKRVSTTKFDVDTDSLEQLNQEVTGKSIKPQAAEQNDSEVHENNGEHEVGPCYVCLTVEQPNAILLDCKHGGLCYECAKGLILHGNQHCPVCREKIKFILRVPNEALKLPEGIECHFQVTEGVAVKSTGAAETIRNNQFVLLFLAH